MSETPSANDLLKELEGVAIHTTKGSFVKMEDLRRLIKERQDKEQEEPKEEAPKTLAEARGQATRFLKKQDFGPQDPQEPGKAIPAREPQPLSRA